MNVLPEKIFDGPNHLEWVSDRNYRCLVTLTNIGHYCGYVGFPDTHPWADMDDWEVPVTVHGGITWSRETPPDGRPYKNKWWLGFDCAHSGDLTGSSFGNGGYIDVTGAVWRSFDYTLREVISLHNQLWEARE